MVTSSVLFASAELQMNDPDVGRAVFSEFLEFRAESGR